MNIIISAVVGVLFGVGAYMMLQRDLLRVVMGLIMIANSINLFLVSAGLLTGAPPILGQAGMAGAENYTDPLVQALVLTAVVIGFAISMLMLALIYRIYTTHHTIDQEGLRQAEEREIRALDDQRQELEL